MIDSDLVGLWKIYKEKAYTMVLNYQYMKTAAGYHEDSGGIAMCLQLLAGTFFIVNSYTCECSSTNSS